MKKNNKMKTAVLVALCSMAIIASGFGISNVVKYTSLQSVDRAVSETDASVCGVTGSEQDPETYRDEVVDNDLHIYDEDSHMFVYDMSESRTSGVTQSWKTENGSYDDMIDFEALYGIRITVKNGTVSYSAYSHTDKVAGQVPCRLYRVSAKDEVFVKNLPSIMIGEEGNTFDTKGLSGLYRIKAAFTFRDIKPECYISFYVSDDKTVACRESTSEYHMSEVDAWNKMLKDADPKNFLSNDKITYPTSGVGTSCVHVKEWEDISDEIILKDEWTDEAKTYAMVKYLADHIAYDDYRYKDPKHRTRANMAGNYSDDNNFTLKNHVGVCWDYTNILTIMCRHHGIPCTCVDSETHTYNIVWLNGRWVGIDVSKIAKYSCDTEDTSEDNWKKNKHVFYEDNYGIYESNMKTYDQNIWTKERGLGQ